MSDKSQTEKCIEYIMKQGVARTTEIASACGVSSTIPTLLRQYVASGILVMCKVEQFGKPPCCEYRPATGVNAANWRTFALREPKQEKPYKPSSPPAHTPADRPAVSETNTGSATAETSPSATTGRAVTEEKPHRKAAQTAPGVGGHVTAKHTKNIPENIPDSVITKFGYFSDGSVRIVKGFSAIELDETDSKRLADFLMNCLISNEVNA